MHVDGQAQRSCVLPVKAVVGRRVVTIEALAATRDTLHPVQQAWLELDVPQCGYCQAGQLMTAAALLRENPHPDDTAIDNAMTGNLCRCNSYTRMRAGIKRAAEIAGGATPARGGSRS